MEREAGNFLITRFCDPANLSLSTQASSHFVDEIRVQRWVMGMGYVGDKVRRMHDAGSEEREIR